MRRHTPPSRKDSVFFHRQQGRRTVKRLKKENSLHQRNVLPLIDVIHRITRHHAPYLNITKQNRASRGLEIFGRSLMIVGIDILIYSWIFYAEESIMRHTAHDNSAQGAHDQLEGLDSRIDCNQAYRAPLVSRGGQPLIAGLLLGMGHLFLKYRAHDERTPIAIGSVLSFFLLGLKTLATFFLPEYVDPQRYIVDPAYCNGYRSGQSLPDGVFGQTASVFALLRHPLNTLVLCYLLNRVSLRQLQKVFDLIHAHHDEFPPELNASGVHVEEIFDEENLVDEQPIPVLRKFTPEEITQLIKQKQREKAVKLSNTKERAHQLLETFQEHADEELTIEYLEALSSFLIQPEEDSYQESAAKFNLLLNLARNTEGESSTQLRKIDLIYLLKAFHQPHLRDRLYVLFSTMEALIEMISLANDEENKTILSLDEQRELLPIVITYCLTTPLLRNENGVHFFMRFIPDLKNHSMEFSHQFFTTYIEQSFTLRPQLPSPFMLQTFLSSETKQAVLLAHCHRLPATRRTPGTILYNLTQFIFYRNDTTLLRTLLNAFFDPNSAQFDIYSLVNFIHSLKQSYERNDVPPFRDFVHADLHQIGIFLKRGIDCLELTIQHLFQVLNHLIPENEIHRTAISRLMVDLLQLTTHRLLQRGRGETDNAALLSTILLLNQEFEEIKQHDAEGKIRLWEEIEGFLNHFPLLPNNQGERIGLLKKEYIIFCLQRLLHTVGQENVVCPLLDAIALTSEDYVHLLTHSDSWLPCVDFDRELSQQDQQLLEHIDAIYLNRVRLTFFMLDKMQEDDVNECARTELARDHRVKVGTEPFTYTPGNALYRLLLLTRLRDEELIGRFVASINRLVEQPTSSSFFVNFLYPSRTQRTPAANLNRDNLVDLLRLLTTPGFLERGISDQVVETLMELHLLPEREAAIALPAP